jgi:hypothetical protein
MPPGHRKAGMTEHKVSYRTVCNKRCMFPRRLFSSVESGYCTQFA